MTEQKTELLAPKVNDSLAAEQAQQRPLRLVRTTSLEPAVPATETERAAYARRFSMLFADESTRRRGGLGSVVRVSNAQGEAFALKTVLAADGEAAASESTVSAFREEYECHRALSGLRGFPRLYAWCEVEGAPAIIMEWVEGMTLASAARALAVDSDGRLSPLVAARLGRDLFDLVDRMRLVGSGVVHRDISPANVMVRTSFMGLDRQLEEGQFDLCLIDFGSSSATAGEAAEGTGSTASPSFTQTHATLRRATTAYAAPEMLTDDLPNLLALRRSSAIDVYAAASVVYELLAGRAPFEGVEATSPYRAKVDSAPGRPVSAHGGEASLAEVLPREPEVAVAAAEVAQQLGLEPGSPELKDALCFVDDQLADILLACLEPEQARRPAARDAYRALEGLCENYLTNIGRSLRGEPLAACPLGEREALGRGALLAAGEACALIVIVAVVASAAMLAEGAVVALPSGWVGAIGRMLVAIALVTAPLVATLVRWRPVSSRRSFLRGSVVLAVLSALVAAGIAGASFSEPAVKFGLLAAVAAVAATTWFSYAFTYALLQPVPGPARALPATAAGRGRTLTGTNESALPKGSGEKDD